MANVITYMIFGWAIGELFHLTLWEWFKRKFNLDLKKVKSVLIFLGLALLIALISSGFYRVQTSQNVILTTVSGHKVVKDSPGIGYSLLSTRQIINVQKQIMRYPFGYSDTSHELITVDEKPLFVSAFLEYQIIDVYKWGIENKDSEDKLLVYFASKVKSSIQESNYTYIKDNLAPIEDKMEIDLASLQNRYGIKIINVNLQVEDTPAVKLSKSQAESRKIEAESLKQSYQSEADALKIKYSALQDKDFIKYMEFIRAIKEGKINTILVPEQMMTSINLGMNVSK